MKYFNICLLFIVCVLCYGLVSAQEDGGPAVSPAKRIAALRRPVGKAAKVTTTTTAAPQPADAGGEGEEYDEEAGEHGDHGEEGDEAAFASSSTTTTTEAPKKVGPVIRPFRSNDDFLNSLKRRQANAKKHRAEKPPSPSKPAKKSEESSSGEQEEPASAPAPAPAASPAKGYKGNSALSRRKLSKTVKATPVEAVEDAAAEESEQQQKEESKPKRPIGRLALRKRN
ncbi:LOW QUALITY PROTEIN: dihydrolipoyllysine-residue acetyltransferase component of pyruvate dehydrogenase complex [Drosophila ficusphila]|uniref:LOW QUALITY PROTEIN: dihydrolipoyllysine-residue acetyltransferase component of pyruvate dehydrogenase complex n=1 Tax=Drosophila ficusphila TaxID=30025 RepID=UPI0007E839F5|nr:LOW QUALITY PROTEIN: dihydrolipoyllysine-residue acetyltransferase component of pyruvate dehydrogenase complex [Drosophila ficusphila]